MYFAKYCDEYVCLCLSVREDISGTTWAIFTKFFVRVTYVRGSVILRQVGDRSHRLSAGRGDGSAQRNLRLPCYIVLCAMRFYHYGE